MPRKRPPLVDRFGTYFADKIRKRRSEAIRRSPQWQWHMDEVFVKIRGERHYLWRAVDHEGEVLESYVTKKRDKAAALKFLKKAMKRYGNPHIVVTDRCPTYRASMKEIGREGRQKTGCHLNSLVEGAHERCLDSGEGNFLSTDYRFEYFALPHLRLTAAP